MATLELTTLDPADFPDQAAARRFVLSNTFEALSIGVQSVLEGYDGGELSRRLREDAREAAWYVAKDLYALARAAAGSARPLTAVSEAGYWSTEVPERLETLYMAMLADDTAERHTKPIRKLIERYNRKIRDEIDPKSRREFAAREKRDQAAAKAEPAGVA